MSRRLALAAVLLFALPSSALANPSFSVSVAAEGIPGNLPSKVTHRLAITAGATAETVGISTLGSLAISGSTQAIDGPRALAPPTSTCGTRWERPHNALGDRPTTLVGLTIAPGATAFVETSTSFVRPPWASDSLSAIWSIDPAQGAAFDIVSDAPDYQGAYGVELGFSMTRVSARLYAVAGSTDTALNSGRVELWGYAPGSKRARRLASAPVRDGAWLIPRLRPSRTGRWEFYARFRSAGDRYANDASACGTAVRIR
jgi:hypothetical protein